MRTAPYRNVKGKFRVLLGQIVQSGLFMRNPTHIRVRYTAAYWNDNES
jgi:hypothetical protein